VDPASRFADLVQQAEHDVPLAEAALLVAAHAHPGLDIAGQLGRLDDLAAPVPTRDLDALLEHLFVRERFAGNRADYYDPANSYLDSVLRRRLGIPLTLSIVLIEVGARVGVPLVGIGMPGHFLVRAGGDGDVDGGYIDAFEGGARLDRAACERRHREVHGEHAAFDERLLRPVGTWAVLSRLLANLKSIASSRSDRDMLRWVLRLRVSLPGMPLSERRELASVLAADGRFVEAADVLDRVAELAASATDAEEAARAATRLRARLN
jgi:regulator of sirC expression with transglutaminase-like and TPR domain